MSKTYVGKHKPFPINSSSFSGEDDQNFIEAHEEQADENGMEMDGEDHVFVFT
jgi:hypothetical protein